MHIVMELALHLFYFIVGRDAQRNTPPRKIGLYLLAFCVLVISFLLIYRAVVKA